ncbi:MAG: GNAT family N-acetyltransferase [Clostridia bacterium]|nr:GNAT family N-acetyltransferase [Clostridia bacterium]
MSFGIHKLAEPALAKPLFGDWPETVIWSAVDGIMGDIYANGELTAACTVLGDFAFIASPTMDEDAVQALLRHVKAETDHELILVAQDEKLFTLCRKLLGDVKTGWRYGFRKDNTFEPEKLKAFVKELPEGYALSGMTPEIWAQIAEKKGWMWDFISNFPDYDTFQSMALGVFALKDGEIVCGASSYSAYNGGIEIEIATQDAHRRKHLARCCAAKLILNCLERGLYASWDAANLTSAALAQQLGYRFSHPYEYIALTPAAQDAAALDEKYAEALLQAKALIGDEPEAVPNMANLSALLNEVLDRINWVGFYTVQPDGNLLLGPFQGKTACIRIKNGRGVCGTALMEKCTQLVPDVHAFPGHIACDSASRSEIVVPVMRGETVFAVLDLDSPIKDRFSQREAAFLTKIAELLAEKL